MRQGIPLGSYRNGAIYDCLAAREDLKRLIFEHRNELAGLRVALVACRMPNGKSWHMNWGFLRGDDVVGVITLFYHKYRFEMPSHYPAERLDTSALTTPRKFLVGCSICGEKDMYLIGALRLCVKHKSVATAKRRKLAQTIFEPCASAYETDNRIFERQQRRADSRHRLATNRQHVRFA